MEIVAREWSRRDATGSRGSLPNSNLQDYDDEAELTQIWEVEMYTALCLERTSESGIFHKENLTLYSSSKRV